MSLKDLKEMKELIEALGLDINEEEMLRSYKQFEDDYKAFMKQQLLANICLN